VRDGSVIGVCVAGRLVPIIGGVGATSAGLTVIVPIEEVAELMRAQGIDPMQTSAPPPRSGPKKRRR
jgi:hypothetical protein